MGCRRGMLRSWYATWLMAELCSSTVTLTEPHRRGNSSKAEEDGAVRAGHLQDGAA